MVREANFVNVVRRTKFNHFAGAVNTLHGGVKLYLGGDIVSTLIQGIRGTTLRKTRGLGFTVAATHCDTAILKGVGEERKFQKEIVGLRGELRAVFNFMTGMVILNLQKFSFLFFTPLSPNQSTL